MWNGYNDGMGVIAIEGTRSVLPRDFATFHKIHKTGRRRRFLAERVKVTWLVENVENNQPRISFFKQVSIYRPPSFLHRLLTYRPSTRNCYPVYQHFFSFSCKPFNRDNVAKLRGFASRNNDGSFYE